MHREWLQIVGFGALFLVAVLVLAPALAESHIRLEAVKSEPDSEAVRARARMYRIVALVMIPGMVIVAVFQEG